MSPSPGREHAFFATLAGLASIALTSAQMREQGRRSAALGERTRIARETHDSYAQVLGAVHLRLRSLEMAPDVIAAPQLAQEVTALAEICAEAYQDVREVIMALRDSETDARGFEETLRTYLAKYSAHFGIATDFVNEVGEGLALSPRAELHLIRVVQEALANVRKHADASLARVCVSATDAATSFTIADNGRGFEASRTADLEGYGLVTMRERLSLLGGTLHVESKPGHGTRVVATVPEAPLRTTAKAGV